MLGAVMSRHTCWNCDYRLDGDPSRCPRCGMPLSGLDARTRPAATGRPAESPAKAKRSRKTTAAPKQAGRPASAQKVEIILPGGPQQSTAVRLAAGAGRGLRAAASGAGRGLLASFGVARKSVVAGAALSVRTARLVGSAAGGVASGVRSGGTRLIAYRPQREPAPLNGDVVQRENMRTLSDVAERLLREAREDNARLATRIAALEASLASGRQKTGKSTAAAPKPATAAATEAATRKAKAGAARTTPRRVDPGQRQVAEAAARPVITIEARAEPVLAANSDATVAPRARRRLARSAG